MGALRLSQDWVRFLIAPELVALPFVQALTTRLGGLPARAENASRLLKTGHRVVCCADARASIAAAVELGVPIVPVTLRGAAWAHSERRGACKTRVDEGDGATVSVRSVLSELGFFALPLHWSMRFDLPIETHGVLPETIFEKLRAPSE